MQEICLCNDLSKIMILLQMKSFPGFSKISIIAFSRSRLHLSKGMALLFVILQVSHFAATRLHLPVLFFLEGVCSRASLTKLFSGSGQFGPVPGPAVGTELARRPDVFREQLHTRFQHLVELINQPENG